MSARDAAATAAVMKALAGRVKEGETRAKADVMAHLDPGDRKHAVLPDGTDIGTVSITKGRETFRVTDPAAFLAWVRDTAPSEVVESVNPTFQRKVLDGIKDGGELPPGVEPGWGDPYVSVRQSETQAEAVAAAWRDGRLAPILAGLLAIEAGAGS